MYIYSETRDDNVVRTWSFLRQQRLTDLFKTNILLNFICPFVPEGKNKYSAKIGKTIGLDWTKTGQQTYPDKSHLQIMANTILPHRHTLCFRVKASTWVRHSLTICIQQGRERKYRKGGDD